MIEPTPQPFGSLPNDSAGFGNVPNATELFPTLRNPSERTENHTLTVREVTRMFEVAGVARTERSIINWCQPNPQGVARLDAFYDPNDRRWFFQENCEEPAAILGIGSNHPLF